MALPEVMRPAEHPCRPGGDVCRHPLLERQTASRCLANKNKVQGRRHLGMKPDYDNSGVFFTVPTASSSIKREPGESRIMPKDARRAHRSSESPPAPRRSACDSRSSRRSRSLPPRGSNHIVVVPTSLGAKSAETLDALSNHDCRHRHRHHHRHSQHQWRDHPRHHVRAPRDELDRMLEAKKYAFDCDISKLRTPSNALWVPAPPQRRIALGMASTCVADGIIKREEGMTDTI